MLRSERQILQSKLHSADTGVINIDAVDFIDLYEPNPYGGSPYAYFLFEAIARLFIERLGVVDAFDLDTRREDDCSSDNRTGEGSDTNFVDTSDVLDACLPQQPFEVQHGIQTIPFLLFFVEPLRQNLVKTPCAGTRISLQSAEDG